MCPKAISVEEQVRQREDQDCIKKENDFKLKRPDYTKTTCAQCGFLLGEDNRSLLRRRSFGLSRNLFSPTNDVRWGERIA